MKLPHHFPCPTDRIAAACFAVIALSVTVPLRADSDDSAAYLLKRNALKEDDPSAHLALASWCETRKLLPQAAVHYRRVLELNPDHESAYDRLVYVSDQHRLPKDAARHELLKREFGDGFRIHLTRHFLVVYNAEEQWSRLRAALLERTHDVYYNTLRRLGYRPMPLTERLVCVLFADHESYQAYAQRTDSRVMIWAAGYYSSLHNRTAFYHDQDNPAYEKVRRRMVELEKAIDVMNEQMRQAIQARNHAIVHDLRGKIGGLRKELNWYRNRIKAVAQLANASKTVHEATHQLAFNSGFQQRGKMYAFWFSEGLATNFETNNPSEPFGPMHDNLGRRKILTDALERRQLTPLKQFVTMRNPNGHTNEQVSIHYAQAWGLFRFLFRYRSEQMRQYLAQLRDAPLGPRNADRMLAEFTAAFGPIEQVQRQWDRHLATLRKPVNVTTDVFKP